MKDNVPLIAYIIAGMDILFILFVVRWWWKNYWKDDINYYKDEGHDDFS